MKVFLTEAASGNLLSAFIESALVEDIAYVKSHKRRFAAGFDWGKPLNGKTLFKIRLESGELLGMMALDIPDGFRAVQVVLIEVVIEQTRTAKKIERIAGCLLAFACQYSIDKGLYGDVFLKPKGFLTEAYKKYGFLELGKGFILCERHASLALIASYFNTEIK